MSSEQDNLVQQGVLSSPLSGVPLNMAMCTKFCSTDLHIFSHFRTLMIFFALQSSLSHQRITPIRLIPT
jgi:hypothetical protein